MPNFFVEAYLGQAGARLHARDFVGAGALVAQALGIEAKNIRGICFKAIIAAETGRKDLALQTIRQALKLGPRMPAVINNAATVFFQCGQPDRARQMWLRLVELMPQSVDALWNLGMFHLRQGATDEAEEYLRKVAQIAPEHPKVFV